MTRFRTRYLLFSMVFFFSCASDYKALRSITPDPHCIQKLKPTRLSTSWFKASIDVVGKHISGLLFIKAMEDGSTRIVFTNEAGIKFLDFEFLSSGDFKVHHVIKQLNKRPVIRLLRNDFALILGIPFQSGDWMAWQNRNDILYGLDKKGEKHYFVTNKDCADLGMIEAGSKNKRMVSLKLFGLDRQQPDSMQLKHHTFSMELMLRKLKKD